MKRFDFEKGPIRRQVSLGGSRAQSRNCRTPDLGFLEKGRERRDRRNWSRREKENWA